MVVEPWRMVLALFTNVGGMHTEAKLYLRASWHTRSQSLVVIVGDRRVWSIIVATEVGNGGGIGGWRRGNIGERFIIAGNAVPLLVWGLVRRL